MRTYFILSYYFWLEADLIYLFIVSALQKKYQFQLSTLSGQRVPIPAAGLFLRNNIGIITVSGILKS